ncbi:tRNA pseudouridine(55) synthase [Dehalogenimonas formicexedens]|uniref:tRNA pseudouridine synthase B n=1 Tax=Dehalogenimonas formicexedens TaxID=1839801 RepID=A0A1P8F7W1_9CHLR|nr:tRNA pseudouridine(55) synthase TruB [Dehalogenimonas formicexedens]APV44540.1 tRNA pseudouridine(55) synthase [Dehalogenimonas formicexedens]
MLLDGWLNIDKPPGMTSYGVIARLKRLTGQRHIGHAGTLDPLATGILPVAFGQAARTIEFLHQVSKTYRAVIELGVETDTLDAEGNILFRRDASSVSHEMVNSALESFTGTIQQVPPMFSALKRNGVPLYEIARRGETVELKPRTVTVYNIQLLAFDPPFVTLEVDCGSGTYIRSIARDLGQVLGVGACLKSLRRTRYGVFDIKGSIELASLETAGMVAARLLPPGYPLAHCPAVYAGFESTERITHGVIPAEVQSQITEARTYRLCSQDGALLAIIDATGADLRLKVFNLTAGDT